MLKIWDRWDRLDRLIFVFPQMRTLEGAHGGYVELFRADLHEPHVPGFHTMGALRSQIIYCTKLEGQRKELNSAGYKKAKSGPP
jgi:hypothetical protein